MSIRTDRSNWSPEEGNSFDDLDKEVQLVSTSSDSYTLSNHTKGSNSSNNLKIISVSNCDEEQLSSAKFNSCTTEPNKRKQLNAKLHSSCDDLSLWNREKKGSTDFDNNKRSIEELSIRPISRSSTTIGYLNQNKKVGAQKYDHVQSKVKQYFKVGPSKNESTTKINTVISEIKETNEKEYYLEEINKQLIKELDEKNTIITLLQENYEHLLFKYAEAQNKLDELRLKFIAKNVDTNNVSHHLNFCKSDNQNIFCNVDRQNREPEVKCQKAVVAPFLKSNQESHRNPQINIEPAITRPSSLPLENNLQFVEREAILTKATTPTDSEGLSSVITSMSGHSKILNSLDEETQMNKKSNILKRENRNLILEENSNMSDSFDKVKNWQNSLPPLEQIETPETALYNISINNLHDKKFTNISSPKVENDYDYLEESCPPSWREDHNYSYKKDFEDTDCQKTCIFSGRTSSFSRNAPKQSILCQTYKKTAYHSIDVCPSEEIQPKNNFISRDENMQNNKDYISFSSTSTMQNQHKRPPLLRCSSLPTYDCDSIKSGHRNGIYIPPLNLNNLTLSDDESYCQQHHYLSKGSNSSFSTNKMQSVDRSIQTSHSFSSCKMTIDEENYISKVSTRKLNKSTSITPDKNTSISVLNPSKYNHSELNSYNCISPNSCIKQFCKFCKDKPKNWCQVCGEPIVEAGNETFRTRSNSCESVHNQENLRKSTSARTKPPFKRSVSFTSEVITSKNNEGPRNFYEPHGQENLENFDVYASNLKARSQAVMKALTAHVNKPLQS